MITASRSKWSFDMQLLNVNGTNYFNAQFVFEKIIRVSGEQITEDEENNPCIASAITPQIRPMQGHWFALPQNTTYFYRPQR